MASNSTTFTNHNLLSDDEIRKLGIAEHDLELYRRKHYVKAFGIPTWYDALQDHTFKTHMLPITFAQANAIKYKHRRLMDIKRKENSVTEDPNHEKTLETLQSTMDDVIRAHFGKGFFVKLDTRSAKDVPVYDFDDQKTKDLICEEIDRLDPKDRNDNNEVLAFVKATNKRLKLTTAAEALEMLCLSERISEDLNKVTAFGEKLFEAEIVFREWLDEVADRPHMEFRGFVHEQHLNALTQYFSFMYFQELVDRKDELAKIMCDFYESIKHHLKQGSYVIDFYVTSTNNVMIIELNPFHNGAGAGLFSWKNDRQRFLEGPFQLRVLEEVPSAPKEILPPYWIKFIAAKYHPQPQEQSGCIIN